MHPLLSCLGRGLGCVQGESNKFETFTLSIPKIENCYLIKPSKVWVGLDNHEVDQVRLFMLGVYQVNVSTNLGVDSFRLLHVMTLVSLIFYVPLV